MVKGETDMRFGESLYWRFKGIGVWRYGWPTQVEHGLVRMGLWNGDMIRGSIVDPNEIEIKQ